MDKITPSQHNIYRWIYENPNGYMKFSDEWFLTLDECIADAEHHREEVSEIDGQYWNWDVETKSVPYPPPSLMHDKCITSL